MLALLAATPLSGAALAQDAYPSKPIRIIIPLAAGSGGDTFTRFFAEKLSAIVGQPLVVENMPGGNGLIAIGAVKSAPADGYTILQGTGATMSVNPVTLKDLPYDPVKDFKPVAGLIRGMAAIVVPANSPFGSFADLVAAGKRAKQPLNAGTYSPAYQLALIWFAGLAGIPVANVPYKGGSQLSMDVVSGQLDFGLSDLNAMQSLIAGGKVRALAVAGETRHPDFPDLPTVAESGYADYAFYTWASLFVRSDVPDPIVATLAAAMARIFPTAEATEFVRKRGAEVMAFGPAEMRKFQVAELERNRRIAAEARIEPQ
jgi:tripartite-type tricarboxylate transporter receptor subunit TctC